MPTLAEDVTGDRAWVVRAGTPSRQELESGTLPSLEADILRSDSDARIPYVSKSGAYYYTSADAKTHAGSAENHAGRVPEPNPTEMCWTWTRWRRREESWVFRGAQFLRPDYRRACSRCRRRRRRARHREFDVSQVVRQGWIPAAEPRASQLD